MSEPRLASGLEVVALPNGVAVVNGGPPVLFTGRAALEVIGVVLGALDGVLNAAGIAAATGLAVAHVERALAELAGRDLLAIDDERGPDAGGLVAG